MSYSSLESSKTQGIEQFGYKQEFKKVLKTRDLVIFGMVFMAPVSAQTLFGALAQVSQGHAVLAYLIGLIAMLFTAYCYGKMAQAYPIAGSTYSYTSQAVHSNVGFIAGWSIMLDYLIFPMLIYKVSALFLSELLPFIPLWVLLLVFLVPVTICNYFGAKTTSRVNIIMTIFMILSIVAFVIVAIKAVANGVGYGEVFTFKGIYNPETFSWDSLMAAASIAVLSYIGFDAVTTMAEDSNVTGKMVGRAAVLACVVSTVFYIAQAYFATVAQPDFNSFETADTAFFEIAFSVGGGTLATFCTLIIAISGISTALAGQAAASRVLFSMGRDKVLPNFFSRLHPKHKTPVNSIIFMAVVGYIGAVFIPLSVFFSIVVFGALIGFICVNLSVFVEYFIRRKERSGLFLITNVLFPILGFLVCCYILVGMDVIGKTVGFCWLAAGIIFLAITTKGFKNSPSVFKENTFE
ncbi:APC family permease [Bacillus sp. Marseille-P3661]|uniref:APC family permease n=1 Tax=Bacillus sp. Marseille-P3661 TaxID=1936234 RepID=UPI000C84B433|nr:APC family permease [Bacillus sp. Marseille-P3661]